MSTDPQARPRNSGNAVLMIAVVSLAVVLMMLFLIFSREGAREASMTDTALMAPTPNNEVPESPPAEDAS